MDSLSFLAMAMLRREPGERERITYDLAFPVPEYSHVTSDGKSRDLRRV